jgi:hypothetical protein
MENGFKDIRIGSNRLYNTLTIAILALLIVILSLIIAKFGILATLMIVCSIVVLFFLVVLYRLPAIGLFTALVISFFAIGLQRYIDMPFGLGVDLTLVLTLLMVFVSNFHKKIDWHALKNPLVSIALVWYLWIFLQLFNPNQPVFEAWFYSMRGFGLYFILIVVLSFLLFKEYKYLKIFLYLWAILSLLGSIKGFAQVYIGLDGFERAWLYGPGAKTHLLFGKIRYWSFYSDAAIYGGGQAQAGVMATIMAIHARIRKEKAFFAIVAAASFYGMMISGTRGSMAVPVLGLFTYIVLTKKIKILLTGLMAGGLIIYFFAFTEIGNGNYNIRRMRTAFHPSEDESAIVRVENRKRLVQYMHNKPFGSGIGSSGNWAIRFSPNSFLANTPTDGWFTQIWVENGIIGLCIHFFILIFILVRSSYNIFFVIKNDELRGKNLALLCPLVGVLAASYSSSLFGQMPVGLINYMSMSFLFMSGNYEHELNSRGV